jgi:hypothetical protein
MLPPGYNRISPFMLQKPNKPVQKALRRRSVVYYLSGTNQRRYNAHSDV